jgi:hypothetical protein
MLESLHLQFLGRNNLLVTTAFYRVHPPAASVFLVTFARFEYTYLGTGRSICDDWAGSIFGLALVLCKIWSKTAYYDVWCS